MKKLFSALALGALFVVIADAVQTEHIASTRHGSFVNGKYQCIIDGQTKTITFIIVNQTTNIKKLVGGSGDTTCMENYTRDTPHVMDVTKSDGSDVASLPCGVTKDVLVVGDDYMVEFSTLSGDNVFVPGDLKYSFTCTPADFVVTDQEVSTNGTDVTGTIKTGTATKYTEKVDMSVVDSDGDVISSSVVLGANIALRVELHIVSGYATGVRLVDCTAKEGSADKLTATMLKSNGCPADALGFSITGFTKNTDSSIAGSTFVAETSQFPAFIFANGGNNVIFSCTAKFCYDGNAACDTSCDDSTVVPTAAPRPTAAPGSTADPGPPADDNAVVRKRRSADEDEGEMDVMVYLKVSTDNRTRDSVLPSQGRDVGVCQIKTYVIGLAILGGLLFLTFIVSVAFFVLIRRGNHDKRSEKHGYENKCVS